MPLSWKQKFDWYDQLTFDKGLSHRGARVAHAIGAHLNSKTGILFMSHAALARELGVGDRTIERAIAELEERGHLSVRRSRGAGRANVYKAVLGSVPDDAEAESSDFAPAESPTDVTEKPDNSAPETRQGCRPYPSYSLSKDIILKQHQATDPSVGSHAPASQTDTAEEPDFVRTARQEAEKEDRLVWDRLAELLTAPDEIDGREVLLNLDAQIVAMLRRKYLEAGDLAAPWIEMAHRFFRRRAATGPIIELLSNKWRWSA